MSVTVNTSGRVYDDFVRILFVHAHRETSILAGEFAEESDQFHFLNLHLVNLEGSVGLILAKDSTMRVTRLL